MVARLERDVDVRPARVTARLAQGIHLRVRQSRFLVMAAADHPAAADHDGADGRIGMRPPATLLRLGEREAHEVLAGHFFCALLRSEISSFSSLMNSPRSLKER